MLYLKQSTASQSVLIGPYVDDTDGATAETGLTIANTDIRLSKNGGNMAAKTSGGGTHDENGWYTITLDATDTNTVGRLQVSSKVAGALAIWIEFQVLEEDIFEALFASGAAAFDSSDRVDVGSWLGTAVTTSATTTKPEVDISSISDDSTAANNLELDYDGTGLARANSTIGTVTTVTNQVTANTTAISGDTVAADNLELDYDGTGLTRANSTIGTVTTVTNQVTANVTAISGDSVAADNLELDYDGTGFNKANSTIGVATTVTNQVSADMTAISGDSVAADNLELDYDGTGLTRANSTIGTVTDVTNQVTADATAISGDSVAADNLEKEYDGTGYGQVMQRTTIATLASQVSFTLTAGSADDDAYNGCILVIEDASTAAQKAVGVISDYTGISKTVTLLNDPGVFTIATTDIVTVIADRSVKPTVDNLTLDVTATGAAGIDWGNIENKTTGNDLSGTDIQLVDTTTTNTDMRGTDSAALASVCTEGRLSELDEATAGKMANQVDVIEADTTALNDTKIPDTISLANINAEVDDVISTDTSSELAAVPAATSTLRDRIAWLFALARNKITQTATTQTLRNDADGADIATAAVSDDATTFIRNEFS